ncbi:MAG: hypothetical protein SGPRY_009457, partial [Prymnesium sp.]
MWSAVLQMIPERKMVPIYPLETFDDARQSAVLGGRVSEEEELPLLPEGSHVARDMPKGAVGAVLIAYELTPLPIPAIADAEGRN